MNTNNEITQNAKATGQRAFQDGKSCTPALDRNCMLLIEQNGQALNILEAWIAGWTKANLSAEVK